MEGLDLLKKSLEPYPRLTPSQWSEANIILPQSVSNRPGHLRLQPWFVQILDELENPDTDEINLCSAAQVGKSLLEQCMMSYCLVVWDCPAMVVFPTESEAEALLRRRMQPIIKASPVLSAAVRTGRDNKDTKEIFGLNSSIKAGWAGSASSLASVPCKVVLLDEVAKYGDSVGEEADAISLASARVASYRRQGAKIISVSTPVTDQGAFHRQYTKGLIHQWHFACPHCGKMSLPIWQRFKWSKDKEVRDIANADVWYECEHCEKKLSEKQYRVAVRTGAWIVTDANASDKPKTSKSYHLSGLLSEAYSFEYLVKEFLKSKDNPQTFQHFSNSILGEFWIDKRIEIKETAISKLIIDLPALQVPPETMKLLAGIDVGGQPGLEPDENGKGLHFWITLLAVHPAGRYTVIYTGRQMGWSATLKFLNQEFYCPSLDKSYFVSQCYVDSGYETETIYGLAIRHAGVIACDGHQIQTEPTKTVMVDTIQGAFGKKRYLGGSIGKVNVDTTYFKDRLWSLIANEHIHFATGIHPDTPAHIASEVKRPINKKGGRFAYFPKYKGIEAHTLDTTVYALAASFANADYRYNSWSEWEMVNIPDEGPSKNTSNSPIDANAPQTYENVTPW